MTGDNLVPGDCSVPGNLLFTGRGKRIGEAFSGFRDVVGDEGFGRVCDRAGSIGRQLRYLDGDELIE